MHNIEEKSESNKKREEKINQLHYDIQNASYKIMQCEIERESNIIVKESKRICENNYNKIYNKKEIMYLKVENKMIHYETITLLGLVIRFHIVSTQYY